MRDSIWSGTTRTLSDKSPSPLLEQVIQRTPVLGTSLKWRDVGLASAMRGISDIHGSIMRTRAFGEQRAANIAKLPELVRADGGAAQSRKSPGAINRGLEKYLRVSSFI